MSCYLLIDRNHLTLLSILQLEEILFRPLFMGEHVGYSLFLFNYFAFNTDTIFAAWQENCEGSRFWGNVLSSFACWVNFHMQSGYLLYNYLYFNVSVPLCWFLQLMCGICGNFTCFGKWSCGTSISCNKQGTSRAGVFSYACSRLSYFFFISLKDPSILWFYFNFL